MCERERESANERKSVCVYTDVFPATASYLCMCERERERECVCAVRVCVCVCVCV